MLDPTWFPAISENYETNIYILVVLRRKLLYDPRLASFLV